MRNLKDTIYEDEKYIIIVKDVDTIGHFEPVSLLDIIHVAIQPLKEWQNLGLQNKEDAQEIIDRIKENLDECIS